MRKLKVFMAACALFSAGTAWTQTTWSGDITNADGLAFTRQYVGLSNGDVAETWKASIGSEDGFDLNQSLTGVPDGVYELSAQAMYRASLNYGTATNCVLYATVGDTEFSTPIANFGDYTSKEDRAATGGIATQMQNNNAYLNIVPAVIVEGGNVTIGMKSIGELAYCTNGYWFVFKKSTFTFKDVTTAYHAKLVARATTMLSTAPESDAKTTLSNALTTYATANLANVKALQAAINTFLATATVENPLNVTDYITNPSFDDNSGNKKNWIQDLGYKQPSDIYQPTGWNMLYSSAVNDNTQWQSFIPRTDGAKDGNCLYVRHRYNDAKIVENLHQLIKELPSGAYRLTVAVKGGSGVTDPNTLTMSAGLNTNTTTVSDFDKTNYKDYSVQVNKENAESDIDISYGWKQVTNGEQLYYIDDFRLYYLGDPVKAKKAELEALQATITNEAYFNNAAYTNVVGEERTNLTTQKTATASSETVDAYQNVIDATQAAIDAFVAAKTNYDALVAEIAKAKVLGIADATADSYAATSTSTASTALTNTQALKVAEYTHVTTTYKYGVKLGEWTSTGENTSAATFSNEHWSGETHEYKNQNDKDGQGWNAQSWKINFSQDVKLPEGNYVFKVAGRQASGDKVNTSLIVKKGDEILGSVSDFPRSNSSRGIDKNGATKFEGENSEFANDGKGYGWEWRYVKFTLSSDATVNIAINSEATGKYQWVSFGDYTVQTDNEANISLIAYNIALESARTTIVHDDYVNVTGSEKTDLQDAIDADENLDKSDKDKIDAAKTLLETRTTAFTDAKSNYDAYVAAKDVVYPTLAYATTEKREALDGAQAAADAESASDADTKTAAILTAARQYYESHALAENVTGAENKTDLIFDPNFADVTVSGTTAGGWTFDQTGGNAQVTSSESFTDGSGNSSYSYFDYYNGSNNNQNIHQVISDLAPGRYLLTATGRGHNNFNGNLQLYVVGKGNVKIPAIGNTGGVFNLGWNDASLEFYQTETANVTIGAKTDNSKAQWWGVTRFRLVRLGDAAENVTVSAAGFATYVPSHDLNFSETSIKAYKVKVTEKGVAKLTKVDNVPAGTPVLLHKEGGATENIPMIASAGAVTENDLVAGTGDAVATDGGEYTNMILNDGEDGIGFYFAAGQTVAKNRAYLHIANSLAPAAASRMVMVFADETQGISAVGASESKAEGYYNLSGQRVAQPTKGLYIVNGKKVIIK